MQKLYKVNLTVRRGDSKITFTFNHLLQGGSEQEIIQKCRNSFPVSNWALKINGMEEQK